jgi:hypothetical protein
MAGTRSRCGGTRGPGSWSGTTRWTGSRRWRSGEEGHHPINNFDAAARGAEEGLRIAAARGAEEGLRIAATVGAC